MRALLIDCETTCLTLNRTANNVHLPRIVEFHGSMVELTAHGSTLVRELDTLVRPHGSIDEMSKATEITGITNEMVRNAPPIEVVFPRIKEIVEASPLVIAHNASFDREVVDIEAERLKATIAWPRVICTVEQTVHLRGYRLSLSDLHEEFFGAKFAGAHRAKADVAALARIVCEMMKRDLL
jgi:DNA polymerase III epsilon subunit-like protein